MGDSEWNVRVVMVIYPGIYFIRSLSWNYDVFLDDEAARLLAAALKDNANIREIR